MASRILVTGGAGFIGSALCRHLIAETDSAVINVDKLTYAANPQSLAPVAGNPRYAFEKVDICDGAALRRVFERYRPDAVMHLAAESHVDRSIDGPAAFIETNVVGTCILLEAARDYWRALDPDHRAAFRFVHVSTDEVYGSLGANGRFCEETPYRPNSPYAATKASADHLVAAWHATYGLPTIITNCSNNYGPYHFPEKLIPLSILNALDSKPIAIYGDGLQVRDWLHVEDHARALYQTLRSGKPGRKYNIGANNERTNLEVVQAIADCLDRLRPRKTSYRMLMTHVADRPGHDRRYAIDSTRLRDELGWQPQVPFEQGIEATVCWYLDNEWWWSPLRGRYSGERLGLVDHLTT